MSETLTYDDLDAKLKNVAAIIAPDIWSDWFDGTCPEARRIEPNARTKYLRAEALARAWRTLDYLGLITGEHRAESWYRHFRDRGATIDREAFYRALATPPAPDAPGSEE